ncbi:MAG: leucine-rich repeat protein, partial [Muribaculaceae bacterium]|nr:leucine-rich repeat protein [Muribaculaceae bacterium]
MKRFLMLIVAVMALVVARGAEQGYFKFEVSNGQAVITGLTTAAQSMNLSTLEIPGFIHYNGLVWPTRIRTSAFQGCKASDIIIHYGCQRIDNYAFSSCNNLQQLRIPSSVTYLGGGLILNSGQNSNSILVAMAGQEPLDEANMYSNAFVGALSTNGVKLGLSTRTAYDAFTQNSLIQGMSFKTINVNAALANDYIDNNGTTYVVTKAATDIADGTMMLVGSINEDVVVRSSMIYLDDYGATDFTHGYRCMEVAQNAFLNTTYNVLQCNIKTLTWTGAPDGSKINSYIFGHGNSSNETLTTINIDCDTILVDAFNGCIALISLTLGEGIKSLGSYAFEGCDLLETVTLPASLNLVGNNPFLSCKALKTINSRGELGKNCFCYDGVLYQEDPENPDLNILVSCPMNIDYSPQIYEKTSEIKVAAFDGLKLGIIELPTTITFIRHYAMANLPNLERLVVHMTTLPSLGTNVWDGVDQSKVTLVVPPGMKATYAAADQWKDFGSIIEENVSYDLYVKGIQVTSSNCDDILGDGTVTYDPVGNKLTLNNATINSATQCIRSKIAGLHIILKGTNTMSSQQYTYGIWLEESDGVVIEGDGTLIMNALSIGYFTKSS